MVDQVTDSLQDESVLLWMGLTDEVLEPGFAGNLRSPVELGSRSAEELLHTFQQLVYVTALMTSGGSRTSTAQLTDRERTDLELVLARTRIGSFEFGFRAHANQGRPDQFEVNVHITLAWTSGLLSLLDKWSNIALDAAPAVTPIVTDFLNTIISSHTAYPVQINPELAIVVVTILASWVKNSKQRNRRLRAIHSRSNSILTPTKSQVDAVLRVDSALHPHRQRRVQIEERPFGPAQGTVEDVDPVHHILRVRFSNFPEPILCPYDPTERNTLGNLAEGDAITLLGIGVYLRASDDLLAVHIDDWSGLQGHSYEGESKL